MRLMPRIRKRHLQNMIVLWNRVGKEQFISRYAFELVPLPARQGMIRSLASDHHLLKGDPISDHGGGYIWRINPRYYDELIQYGQPDPESVACCQAVTAAEPGKYREKHRKYQENANKERRDRRRGVVSEPSWIKWRASVMLLYQRFGSDPFTRAGVNLLLEQRLSGHWPRSMQAAGLLERVNRPGVYYRITDKAINRLQRVMIISPEGVTA